MVLMKTNRSRVRTQSLTPVRPNSVSATQKNAGAVVKESSVASVAG